MLWLYRLLFVPVLVVLSPRYFMRMRQRGGYANNFRHRFGFHPTLRDRKPGRKLIWLQAVSVGEVLAIGPLMEKLASEGVDIYLTTTTSTGYRLARDRYRGQTIGIGYFPIDWWFFSVIAWRRIAPDLIVLMEGERWPEHLAQARKHGVPVMCVNARLSERSYKRMKSFGPSARITTQGVSRLLAGSAHDAERFAEVGVPRERITVTGNLKFDVTIPRLSSTELAQLRRDVGLPEGLVLMGASTWAGEEEALLAAQRAAREAGLPCSLLIVPRHAERRLEIDRLLRTTGGLKFHFRSRGPAPEPVDVFIGDTTGEMRKFLQIADLVFIGKSLGEHTEGQTPVEAAVLGRPMMYGPGMSNFRVIARELLACGGALEVADATALRVAVPEVLRDATRRDALAQAARAWHSVNVGASIKTIAAIREELAKLSS